MGSAEFFSRAAVLFANVAQARGRSDVVSRFDLTCGPGVTEIPITVDVLERFSSALAIELEDDHLGLRIGAGASKGTYGLVEYAVRTSATLRDACYRLVRYHRTIHPVVQIRFEEALGKGTLWHGVPGRQGGLGRQCNEFVLALMVRGLRDVMGERLSILELRFAHVRPATTVEQEAFFRCAMSWGHSENALVFPEPVLATEFPRDEALARVLEQQAEMALAATSSLPVQEPQDWLVLARSRLREAILQGHFRADDLARRLGVSSRSLQRRLQTRGVTFQSLLGDVRRELADQWLVESRHSLAAIAFLLGFSGPSAFTRAYTRWTGAPPSRRREHLAAERMGHRGGAVR